MMKKIIAILLFILSLLNIIPLFIFKDDIAFSQYSIPPLMLMLIVIINGVLALIFKHKGNFFIIRKYNNPFTNDKDYTFTPEYDKRFILSFAIYFAPIPFYLPLIFFTRNWAQTLFLLLLLALPQIIFIIQGMIEIAKDVKADKIKKQQQEQELREQQIREELGNWK